MPIISEGDIAGCVVSLCESGSSSSLEPDIEKKIVTTAATFLGKQIES
jgi:hypothetical protein